jgi:hypothetical protein
MRKSKYTKELLEQHVATAISYATLIQSFGLKPTGGTYVYFQKLVRQHEINVDHFKGQGWAKGHTVATNESVRRITELNSYADEDVLCENAPASVVPECWTMNCELVIIALFRSWQRSKNLNKWITLRRFMR